MLKIFFQIEKVSQYFADFISNHYLQTHGQDQNQPEQTKQYWKQEEEEEGESGSNYQSQEETNQSLEEEQQELSQILQEFEREDHQDQGNNSKSLREFNSNINNQNNNETNNNISMISRGLKAALSSKKSIKSPLLTIGFHHIKNSLNFQNPLNLSQDEISSGIGNSSVRPQLIKQMISNNKSNPLSYRKIPLMAGLRKNDKSIDINFNSLKLSINMSYHERISATYRHLFMKNLKDQVQGKDITEKKGQVDTEGDKEETEEQQVEIAVFDSQNKQNTQVTQQSEVKQKHSFSQFDSPMKITTAPTTVAVEEFAQLKSISKKPSTGETKSPSKLKMSVSSSNFISTTATPNLRSSAGFHRNHQRFKSSQQSIDPFYDVRVQTPLKFQDNQEMPYPLGIFNYIEDIDSIKQNEKNGQNPFRSASKKYGKSMANILSVEVKQQQQQQNQTQQNSYQWPRDYFNHDQHLSHINNTAVTQQNFTFHRSAGSYFRPSKHVY